MIKILILGSKEYPFGSGGKEDPIPSGGMETYVDDLVPFLSKYCKVAIITRKFRKTKKHELKGNIEVFRVPWIKGRLLRGPSFNFFSFLSSLRVARGADVIYSNGIVSGFFGMLLGKLLRKKSVYRPAGISFNQFGFLLGKVLFLLEKLVFKKSDAIVFHSEGERKNAREFFRFRSGNSHVILTGFPVGKFKSGKGNVRKELGLGNRSVIITISRFVPVKGLEYLIKACSLLKRDFRLLMVGSGPLEGKLKSMSKDSGIGDKVIFTGFRHDVPALLSSADIFVISSLSEGLPTSLLEAMAAKKACVVTDIGLPVEHMKTAMVASKENSVELKNAIEVLLKEKSLRKKLGESAGRFVSENCTQDISARKHLRLFQELLGRTMGDVVS